MEARCGRLPQPNKQPYQRALLDSFHDTNTDNDRIELALEKEVAGVLLQEHRVH